MFIKSLAIRGSKGREQGGMLDCVVVSLVWQSGPAAGHCSLSDLVSHYMDHVLFFLLY